MLVDRIITIEGRKGSLKSGRVVTEHDVLPEAWYLDGNRAPACISVEAGQADLFLCAYLGVDLAVAGRRAYRLLDATVTFHRGLPRPGETIRYDIHIDKFIRQGDVYMFLFRFEGQIEGKPLITMTDGCAGFFTPEEIRRSGGILPNAGDEAALVGRRDPNWKALVPVQPARYSEAELDALRRGDVGACFGEDFSGIELPAAQKLPGGRMRLIHRIRSLDPAGGRFGLGIIQAEADIHPHDWFLTCHFVDDMVMPGTLMYECCVHSLRVMLQRFGWITDQPEACWAPVIGVPATLKCRGPVTPETRRVLYEIEIKEIGYRPQPYAIADAHIYADDHRIVRFIDMSLQLSDTSRPQLEDFWRKRRRPSETEAAESGGPPVFDRHHLETFASGKPSAAFGQPYRLFDQGRFIARLPKPPFLFIDRIVKVEPEPWILKPGGWIEAEYELQPKAWYFRANRCPVLPLGILMEIALQPCGWLAAYMGSALKSDKSLCFRNLKGEGMIHRNLGPEDGQLSIRTRLTQVSKLEDMIIEYFEFQIGCKGQPVYAGTTHLGFFTPEALTQQEDLRHLTPFGEYRSAGTSARISHQFDDLPPLSPEDPEESNGPSPIYPAKALRMIDWIDAYDPKGGPHGMGYIRGTKIIDPDEWFFKAHFHQDPVYPGSLGIEAFIQLLKFITLKRYGKKLAINRIGHLPAEQHSWNFRGQITPCNRHVTVEAVITDITESPEPMIRADGVLSVDDLPIYRLQNFGISVVRKQI
jgi:3-hydroxymyristoyl/3-hydroxydecanoyl-(acyl carrier protein) dehydratase